MKRNNKFYLMSVFLIVILFIGIGFVNSQEEVLLDLSVLGDITGQGVGIVEVNGNVRLEFLTSDAILTINGFEFKNIVGQESEDAELPSYIDIDENGKISRAEFTVNGDGGTYLFGNTQISVPEGSRVFFNEEEGIRIIFPEGFEITQLPIRIDDSLPSDFVTTFEGENFELPNGAIVTGRINFENGQAFLRSEDTTTIDGVKLGRGEFGITKETKVYFDGKKHPNVEGSYVSVNAKEREISAGAGKFLYTQDTEGQPLDTETDLADIVLTFTKDNPFIDIENTDKVRIHLLSNSDLNIDGKEVIPSVTFTETINDRGAFTLDNGLVNLNLKPFRDRNVVGSISNTDVGTSSPMEIIIQDNDGKNLLGSSEEPKKFIITNSNEIITFPLDAKIESRQPVHNEAGNQRLYFDKKTLSDRLSGLEYMGGGELEGQDPLQALSNYERDNLFDAIRSIPSEIWATEGFVIYDGASWVAKHGRNTGAFIDEGGKIIHIPEYQLRRSLDSLLGTIWHENLHVRGYKGAHASWKNVLPNGVDYGIDAGPTAIESELYLPLFGFKIPFFTKKLYDTWENGKREPRYGFVSEYSANNRAEYYATAGTFIELNPRSYRSLVNPLSNFYFDRIGKEYKDGIMTPERAKIWADSYLKGLLIARQTNAITRASFEEAIRGIDQNRIKEITEQIGSSGTVNPIQPRGRQGR